MKKLYFLIILKLIFLSSVSYAQTYQSLNINGFNQDVIANGVGPAVSSTTVDVDGVSYCFKSMDWQLTSTSTPQASGFPINGIINSAATTGLTYLLQNYSANNVIQLVSTANSITSKVTGTVKAKKLFILATSGSGTSNLECVVTFQDDTTESFLTNPVPDWFNGTNPPVAYSGFGRLNRNNNGVEFSTTNPRLYQITLNIAVANQNKEVKSITFTRNATSGGVLNIFAVSGEIASTCVEPTDAVLTSATENTAIFSWTASIGLPANGYAYEVRTEGNPDDATGRVASGTTAAGVVTATVNGLLPNTAYKFYVKAVCSGTDSSAWTEVLNFRTDCAIENVPYIMDINYVTTPNVPFCLAVQNVNADNKTWISDVKPDGSLFRATKVMKYPFHSTNAANDWFFTNAINLVAGQSYRLKFKYADSGWVEKLRVSYGSTAVNTGMTTELFTVTTGTGSTTVEKIIDFTPATSGVYYIGFQAFSNTNKNILYVGDIELDKTPTCFVPGEITVDQVALAHNSVTFTWGIPEQAPATGYEYEVRTSGNPGEVAGRVATGSVAAGVLTATANGLTPLTDYKIYIRSKCIGTDVSIWTAGKEFTTLCLPPVIASTTGATVCGFGQATLQATSNEGTFRWYETATNSTVLGTGSSFVTPELSQTTSFWVSVSSDDSIEGNVGKVAPTTSSTYSDSDTGIVFDVIAAAKITTADIYSKSNGTINVKITNSSGIEIYSTGPLTIQGNGLTTPNRIPINYDIQPGTGYRMLIKTYSGVGLIRESSGVSYPYTNNDNILKVTGGYFLGNSSSYYYFYNIGYEVVCTSERKEVIATIYNTPAPTAADQSFCIAESKTIDDLVITGADVKWYNAQTGGTPLDPTTVLVSGTYYATQTLNGCESVARTEVVVTIYNTPVPTAADQAFCIVESKTIDDLVVTGTDVKWYNAQTGGTALDPTTVLISGTYYATQTLNGCESVDRTEVAVTIYNTPAPTAADQAFCIAESKTIDDLVVTGTDVKWYDVATGGTALDPTALLIDGTTYYATQTLNNCESVDITPVVVTIEAPTAPTVNATIQYTYGETAVALTATTSANHSLLWYTTETGGTSINTSPTPTTDAVGTQTYWVSQVTTNGCESERTKIEVIINQATLTITADANQGKVYGETDPVLTYTVSGYQHSDDNSILSGALSRVAGENVGTYAIEQGTLTAGNNYDIVFVSDDFTINKATLTITVEAGQSKVYGEVDSVLTYTVSGYQRSDDNSILSGALTRAAGENVGTYAIEQGTLTAGDNYDIVFISNDFTINKATLTITADANQSKGYGNADPVLTYTVSGYQHSDDDSILTGALSRIAGENVGTYAIEQGTLTAGDNYVIVFVSNDFEITKATLTITADANQNKMYGETDPVLTYIVSGYQYSDDDSILSGALSRAAGENVGTYAIEQGTLTAGDNYVIVFVSNDFTITKATLTITADANQSKMYGETDPVLTYTVSGYQGTDDNSILSGALTRVAGENVGTYAIEQGTLTAGDNYDIVFVSNDFEITKATLTITADANQNKMYGETDPVLTYIVSGYQYSDDDSILSGALSRAAGENVGTYAIEQGTLTAGDNYVIVFVSNDFTITKATLTITADANQSKMYGETDPVLTYTVSGYQGTDDNSILSGALTRVAGENVGTYAIEQGTLTAGDNYDIVFISDDFTINKATLTITANSGQGKGYGDADPVLTYTDSGYQGTDNNSILSGTLSRVAGEDVGTYVIEQGTLTAGDNYDIVFVSNDFTINKAILTITADANQSKGYGDADPVLTYTDSGYQGTDNNSILSGTLSRVAGEDVGTYAIEQGTLTAGDNYDIVFISDDFTITKATLTITPHSGQGKGYGETDPVLTYTDSGYQGTDNNSILSGALSRAAGENVGTYAIEQGTLTAGDNYDIVFVSDDFTINKATLTITANSGQGKVYGETDPVLTYTDSGYQGTDNNSILSGALTRVAGENVGTYAIEQGTLTAGDNYDIVFISDDFTITKATLTITPHSGQGKGYGETDPVLTYTDSGYQGTDNNSILSGALSRIAGENVGTYAIEQGTLTAGDNYDIVFVSNDFTINKATLTITANSGQGKVYGETDPVLTYTDSGYQRSDDDNILSGALTRVAGENVGTYAIEQGTLTAGDNYDIVFVIDDFTITKATLTITADSGQSKVYGETDPVLTYTDSGYQHSDNNSILSGALSRAAGEDVGIYTIEQGILTAGDNYDIVFVSNDFTINKATLTITANSGQGKVYGETDPVLTYTDSGYQGTDNNSILSGALTRVAGENVGTYAIEQGTLTAGDNYDIVFVSNDFTITKATLTITPHSGQSKTYGSTNPVYPYDISGFVLGDTAAVINGTLGRQSGENVGTYLYNAGSLTAQNYTFVIIEEYFAITPAPIEVHVNPGQSKAYGAADPVLTYTANGLVNGDTQANAFTGSLQRVPGENTGVYAVKQGTLQPNANYQLTSFTGADFEIKKAVITGIKLENATFVYDGTPKSLYLTGNIQPGAQVSYTGNGQTEAGEYTVTATIDYGSNYEILILTAKLKIVQAEQVIDFELNSPVILEDMTPFQLDATASSGLAVYYSFNYIENHPAMVSSDGHVALMEPGTVEITAHQEGNNNYKAAQPITRTLVVESRDSRIWELYIDGEKYENPSKETWVIKGCDDTDSPFVEIQVETQAGATVSPSEVIVVPTPEYGTYEVEIIVTSPNGKHSQTYKVIIEKRLPWEGVLMQKYDNLVFVNNNPATNGGHKFVRYQWYKNGMKVADHKVFSEGAAMDDILDPEAEYHAILYTQDEQVLTTCTMGVRLRHDYALSVYPNPVAKKQALNVRVDDPKEAFEQSDYSIYSQTGQLIQRGKLTQALSAIGLPPTIQAGTYILVLKIDGEHKSVHFIVKP